MEAEPRRQPDRLVLGFSAGGPNVVMIGDGLARRAGDSSRN